MINVEYSKDCIVKTNKHIKQPLLPAAQPCHDHCAAVRCDDLHENVYESIVQLQTEVTARPTTTRGPSEWYIHIQEHGS